MTDTQPAAQVDVVKRLRAAILNFGHDDSYWPEVCQAADAATDALEAAQREIAELRAEVDLWRGRDRRTLLAAFVQGSEVTVGADGRLHLAEGEQ